MRGMRVRVGETPGAGGSAAANYSNYSHKNDQIRVTIVELPWGQLFLQPGYLIPLHPVFTAARLLRKERVRREFTLSPANKNSAAWLGRCWLGKYLVTQHERKSVDQEHLFPIVLFVFVVGHRLLLSQFRQERYPERRWVSRPAQTIPNWLTWLLCLPKLGQRSL